MFQLIGRLTPRSAVALLVAAAIFGPAVRPARAQTSLGELGATQAIGNELDGNTRRQKRDDSPEEAPEEKAPNRGAVAEAPDFAARAQTFELNVGAILKVLALVVIFFLWVQASNWVNQDSQIHRIGYQKWNSIIFFPFVIVGVALLFLPLQTLIRAPIWLVMFLATWIPYVVAHNKRVQPHQMVLTGSWWRYVFASAMSKIGIKMSAERKAEYEKGAPVELLAMGAEDANADNANLLSARNSPGYLLLKDVIVDMVDRRSEKAMFDYTKTGVNVRYEIDGVWHAGEPRERDAGDVMLAVIKTLANLSVKDRRNKQAGQFGAKYQGKSFFCPVVTQGVSTGERVTITRLGEQQHFETYDDLGMREGIQEQWSNLMAAEQGMLILSTLPSGGLTTITNVSVESTDRLMRDFAAIEDVHHPEAEIQNLSVTTYDSAASETPATILPRLIRTYPNVYVCRDLVDVESANLLFNEVRDERLLITTVRARTAAEVLLRILQMKVPAKEFAAIVTGVLYQRLVRTLCPDCKVGYTPPAEVWKKLGIPAGKIESLYRPPKPEEIEKPCTACQGIGYRGRTGIFELLVVNGPMREILVKQPKIELLKKAARAARQRSLQEEGILLVAKGLTSLQELQRVLKQ